VSDEKPSDVLFTIRDVSLQLGGQPILHQLSFDVHDRVRPGLVTGQIVALLGPSGVGKTRLLRIIAGLDAPDDGSVIGPDRKPLVAGEVGIVFQDYPLLRHRTIIENLIVAGVANGMSNKAARARGRTLLERFGLLDRASRYPAQLSGGQRQRAAIAQQIMCPKQLLLFDEPFSGLDPPAADTVIRLLVEVANMSETTTLIIVTHDIFAAMMVSDTLLLLGRSKDRPGASIVTSYDLVARGLAWREHVNEDPAFVVLEHEIRARFATL
jgi:polar amino acid transport system ATP-binding protein/sulfate transport system ATP-binding protein